MVPPIPLDVLAGFCMTMGVADFLDSHGVFTACKEWANHQKDNDAKNYPQVHGRLHGFAVLCDQEEHIDDHPAPNIMDATPIVTLRIGKRFG